MKRREIGLGWMQRVSGATEGRDPILERAEARLRERQLAAKPVLETIDPRIIQALGEMGTDFQRAQADLETLFQRASQVAVLSPADATELRQKVSYLLDKLSETRALYDRLASMAAAQPRVAVHPEMY